MSEHIEDHAKLYEAARSLRKTGMPLTWRADEISSVLDELIRLRHVVASGLAVSINQENKELKFDNEALRKDAARIDFIEKYWFYTTRGNNQEFCFVETWSAPGETLRDAIDAAMIGVHQS